MIKPKENKIKTFLDGKTWLRYSISVWDDIEKALRKDDSKFMPYHVDIINLLNSIGFQLEDIII